MEPSLKAKARKAAQSRGISVSALFSNFVSTLSPDDTPPLDLNHSPLTVRAVRLFDKKIKRPKDWDYRAEAHDIIVKKYS